MSYAKLSSLRHQKLRKGRMERAGEEDGVKGWVEGWVGGRGGGASWDDSFLSELYRIVVCLAYSIVDSLGFITMMMMMIAST